jgi:hypothetical protein
MSFQLFESNVTESAMMAVAALGSTKPAAEALKLP